MKGLIEFVVMPDEVLEVKGLEGMMHTTYNVDVIQGLYYNGNEVGIDLSFNTNTTTLTFKSAGVAFDFYCAVLQNLKEATE